MNCTMEKLEKDQVKLTIEMDAAEFEEGLKKAYRTMVKDINDWMFDEARKDGDVEIITSEYGPHLVYFVGRGRDKYELDIVELLAYDRFEKWYEEDKANHKVSVSKIVTSLI